MVAYLRKLNTMFQDLPKYDWKGKKKKSWNLDSVIAEFVAAKLGIFLRPEEVLCINGSKGKHRKDPWDKSLSDLIKNTNVPTQYPHLVLSLPFATNRTQTLQLKIRDLPIKPANSISFTLTYPWQLYYAVF